MCKMVKVRRSYKAEGDDVEYEAQRSDTYSNLVEQAANVLGLHAMEGKVL